MDANRTVGGRRRDRGGAFSLPEPLAASPTLVLVYLAYQARRRVDEGLATLGLRGRQYAMLLLLHAERPPSQQALGERLGIDRSSMVTITDELEALGLVERVPVEGNRRARAVRLTPRGEALLADATARMDVVEQRLISGLAPAERAQLHRLLLKLCQPAG